MSQMAFPNPSQVPTLTEVIELLSPAPVGETGLHNLQHGVPPPQGSPGSAPIVTGGLAANQTTTHWTPMNTVVLDAPQDVPVLQPDAIVEMPVLQTVVPEPVEVQVAVPVPAAGPAPVLPEISEAQLAQRVMAVVQKQIDSMIDFRLREAMAPILSKHTDALVRDLREELAQTMRDVVARAVAQEMAKLRQR